MKLSGKITKRCQSQTGEGPKGPWVKQDFVLELDGGGDYPDTIVITAWGADNVFALGEIKDGTHVILTADLRAEEYQNKFYQRNRLYRFDTGATGNVPSPGTAVAKTAPGSAPIKDELPF